MSCRKEIGYALQVHGLSVNVDENAVKLLRESISKEKGYNELATAPSMTWEEVQSVLKQHDFCRPLTEEQKRNVCKLVSLSAGATFSVPGAGKTTEALAYYCYKKDSETKLLVIAPKNAFPAWEEQLQQCMTDPPEVIRLRGGYQNIEETLRKRPEIMLVTYQQLPGVLNLIADYVSEYPTMIFLDESHRIKKGFGGIIGSAVLALSHIPKAKLIMSGTPMPNSIEDLVPQFKFLFPEVDIDKDNVHNHIKPIYVRTTKKELGLPEIKYILKPITMSEGQRRLYELLRSEEARQAEKILKAPDRNKLRAMGKSVLRLLQLTSNSSLLAKVDFQFQNLLRDILLEGNSPKIQYVCNRARELAKQGRKTIIWSSFVENVELVNLRLRDLGADFIHGGVDAGSEEDADTREAKIKRFHDDPNAFVLVANPAAAGEGISLHTVCHDAIYLDRNYNAAQFLQSVDRIHRLGLDKAITTTVEILYCPDSVDESVTRRINFKINKMAEVLNDNSLRVELEYADEEMVEDELSLDDISDFVKHLRRDVS